MTPDYFSAMGTPLFRGRGFLASGLDVFCSSLSSSTPPWQRRYWHGEDPLGKKQLSLGNSPSKMTIVGVTADVKHLSLREESAPEMFVPYTQRPFPSMQLMHVVLRAGGVIRRSGTRFLRPGSRERPSGKSIPTCRSPE